MQLQPCARCGASVAAGNMELHGLRCPGHHAVRRGEDAGAEAAASADGGSGSGSSADGEEDPDLRLALALSLGEPTAAVRGGSPWACAACTVPVPLPLFRRPGTPRAGEMY